MALVSALIAVASLRWSTGPPGSAESQSVHAVSVRLLGPGLHRDEALVFGASFRWRDLVTLLLAAPLLALAAWRARSGDGGWVLWRTALLASSSTSRPPWRWAPPATPCSWPASRPSRRASSPPRLGGAQVCKATARALSGPALPRRGSAALLAAPGLSTAVV